MKVNNTVSLVCFYSMAYKIAERSCVWTVNVFFEKKNAAKDILDLIDAVF